MFTGIIEEIGKVISLRRLTKSASLRIAARQVLTDVRLGDSIAVCGVCLTVTRFDGESFEADVMPETLARSTLGSLQSGSLVNLERAMAANGRFGGHLVTGHIDGRGALVELRREDKALWFRIRAEARILRYIIEKGSITIDGISLTVARVTEQDFSVSVIPHTAQQTTLSARRVGDLVNLENDCIGKYIEKLAFPTAGGGITQDFLNKFGF